MGSARARRLAAAGVVGAILLGGLSLPAQAAYDPPPGYPSWDEVQAAMSSEETKAAEAKRVEAALVTAQAAAAVAAQMAVDAAGVEQQAKLDLDDAAARLTTIDAQLSEARSTAQTTHDSLGRVVAARQRDIGSGSVATQLLAAEDPDQFMAGLMTSERLTKILDREVGRARAATNEVGSLSEQAGVAKAERAKLETAARAAAEAAATASADADAKVAEAQSTTDILYAQLATLKSTTADVEKRYQLGQKVAAEAAELQRQREEEARRKREEEQRIRDQNTNTNTDTSTTSDDSFVSTDGVVVDPAAAQAYARGAIGAYGWGSDQFGCLVDLWNGESGWRANALNPDSGAYGIPQSWPASKLADAGPDWRTNANTQINWGLAYIDAAYGSPCNAWGMWNSRWPHWY